MGNFSIAKEFYAIPENHSEFTFSKNSKNEKTAGGAVSQTRIPAQVTPARALEYANEIMDHLDKFIKALPDSHCRYLKAEFASCQDVFDDTFGQSLGRIRSVDGRVAENRTPGSAAEPHACSKETLNALEKKFGLLQELVKDNSMMKQEPNLAVKILGYCGAVLAALGAAALLISVSSVVGIPIGLGVYALFGAAAAGVGMLAQSLALTHMMKCARDQANLNEVEFAVGHLLKVIDTHLKESSDIVASISPSNTEAVLLVADKSSVCLGDKIFPESECRSKVLRFIPFLGQTNNK